MFVNLEITKILSGVKYDKENHYRRNSGHFSGNNSRIRRGKGKGKGKGL